VVVVVGFEEEEFARDLLSYRKITWTSLAVTVSAMGAVVGTAAFVALRRDA